MLLAKKGHDTLSAFPLRFLLAIKYAGNINALKRGRTITALAGREEFEESPPEWPAALLDTAAGPHFTFASTVHSMCNSFVR